MLDLRADAVTLTAALVDIPSESGDEARITDLVEAALRECAALRESAALPGSPGLTVQRDGNVVLARTELGRARRVVLAGHLDTVPIADNVPSRLERRPDGDVLHGCGTADMKSGDAIMLRIAHLVATGELDPGVDLTWVFYDCEEVEAARNGLGRLARERPDELLGDLAILLEGTTGGIEGGCQGTLRVIVRTRGVRAHSARSWLGENAIHAAAPVLARLAAYEARVVDVDGLTFREGLNAVGIAGGVAGNVVPDACAVTVNYRFAPDRSAEQAQAHVREVFDGYDVELTDLAPGARPGLDTPIAAEFVAAVGGRPSAKLGYTDVSMFGRLGVPAVNFGPGDPNVAHRRDEHVVTSRILAAEAALVRFLRR